MNLAALLVGVFAFLLYLAWESHSLRRQRDTIALRLSVTGTRGKSSVVRIIAAILRADGRTVVAKTTGSQARFILPDGRELEVPRRGPPSIIEQKRLIKLASRCRADCLVAEVMSIHPENHWVEARQLLQPQMVVITNVRPDHLEAMGETKAEIAAVLSLAIPTHSRVFVPEKENYAPFAAAVKQSGGELITVPPGLAARLLPPAPELQKTEFADNLALAAAVASHLGITAEIILQGMRQAQYDLGKFGVWRYRSPETEKTHYFVNGFAANDPESTWQVLAKAREILPAAAHRVHGLLSLRPDRGDRTQQWLHVLVAGAHEHFGKLYVTGAHAPLVARRLQSAAARPAPAGQRSTALPAIPGNSALPSSKKVGILKGKTAAAMMQTLLAECEDQSVIFGFGNLKGTGELLVNHWKAIGEAYGL